MKRGPSRHRKLYSPPPMQSSAVGGLILLIVAALLSACDTPRITPRHVVLISIDTLRRDRLPCYGHPGDTAPFITELATQSVIFDNAIAAASLTAPSHASIFTGLYPPRHGVLNNKCHLQDGVATLARILSANGFRTAAFVSATPLRGQINGLDSGFDVYDDDFGSRWERPADETAHRVGQWLSTADPEKPTLLFVHFFDPHYPYSPPARFAEPFLRPGTIPSPSPPDAEFARIRERGMTLTETRLFKALYDGEIRYVDHHVGRLLALLKEKGFLDRSLLILLSDHGETLAERSWVFDHGCRLYDEQVRVPLLIRFPNAANGGQRIASDAHHIDVAPTILDSLGLNAPPSMEGISLLGAIGRNKKLEQRALFSMARCDMRRVFQGRTDAGFGFIASVRAQPFKLVAYPVEEGFDFEIFDLAHDPSETVNLAASRDGLHEQLWTQLESWLGGRPELLRELPETLLPELKPKLRKALEELGYIEHSGTTDQAP